MQVKVSEDLDVLRLISPDKTGEKERKGLCKHGWDGLSRPFLNFFKKIFSTFTAPWLPYALDRVSLRVLSAISVVLPHYIIIGAVCQEGCWKNRNFFQPTVSYSVWAWLRHTDFSVLYPCGAGSTRPVSSPPDIINYNRFLGKMQVKVFRKFRRLTSNPPGQGQEERKERIM